MPTGFAGRDDRFDPRAFLRARAANLAFSIGLAALLAATVGGADHARGDLSHQSPVLAEHSVQAEGRRAADEVDAEGLESGVERPPDPGERQRLFVLALGALTVTSALLLWNAWLGRRVRESTRELQAEVSQRQRAEDAGRAGEERFRAMFGGAAAGIAVTTPEGRFVSANPAYCATVGYAEDELQATDFHTLTHPDDRSESLRASERLLAGDAAAVVLEQRYLCKRGDTVWARVTFSLQRAGEGAPVQLVATSEDITERKRADGLLEGQRRVLEMIATSAPLDETLGALLSVVEGWAPEILSSILLLDREGQRLRHGAAPRLSAAFRQAIDGALIGERAGSCGAAAYRRAAVFVEDIQTDPLWEDYRELASAEGVRACWSTPIFDAQKRVLGTFALYHREPGSPSVEQRRLVDMVTQVAAVAISRKREEEAMRESEGRYRSLFQSAPDGILVADPEGRYLDVNRSALSMLGYARDEVIGMTSADILAPSEESFAGAALAEIKQGIEHRREWQFRRKDGSVFPADVMARVLDDGRILALIRDASELKQAEEALRESRKRLLSIYDTVGDVIFLAAIEPDGGFRFVSVNKRFVETTGLPSEAVVGKRVEQVIPAESLPLVLNRYRKAVRDQVIVRWEETSEYPTGRLTGEVSVAPIVDETGRSTHLVGAVHDVTARKVAEERQAQVEEMLRQSQKLEGIGRLAGGVAHDFNNVLGVILGYGELMRRQLDVAHPARPRLELMIQAANRAAGLTRQLLAFSRKQVMQPKLLDLSVVVGDMRSMLDRLIGEDIEIDVPEADRPSAVLADPTQVEQIVMNLVVNARDAMPKGGRLTIETANVEFDETYAKAHPPASPGHFAMLAVTDTGTGMSPETQARIFEPFFTTKPVGEGTGLGLATVYGVVKQMGGHIWVYSEVGRGTSFKVYLPRAEESYRSEASATPPPMAPRGSETVLVVEDSEAVRNLIQELLTAQGYRVLTATQGEEALELVGTRADPIDLVLTDVVMPKLGGADLARRLRATHPHIRILYMSGYTDGAISRGELLDEGSMLLEKPFAAEHLARKVREALDAHPKG